MIGSAKLIFRMMINGARKNSSSQRYGVISAIPAFFGVVAHSVSNIALLMSQEI